jgi:hypothetical protein
MEDQKMATLGNADVHSRISIKGLIIVIVPQKKKFSLTLISSSSSGVSSSIRMGLAKSEKVPMGPRCGQPTHKDWSPISNTRQGCLSNIGRILSTTRILTMPSGAHRSGNASAEAMVSLSA